MYNTYTCIALKHALAYTCTHIFGAILKYIANCTNTIVPFVITQTIKHIWFLISRRETEYKDKNNLTPGP